MCVDACCLTSCSYIFSLYARDSAVSENCFEDLKVIEKLWERSKFNFKQILLELEKVCSL